MERSGVAWDLWNVRHTLVTMSDTRTWLGAPTAGKVSWPRV
jgi:hypothetical protein